MTPSRRQVVGFGAAAGVTLVTRPVSAAGASPRIGLQAVTVLPELTRDTAATLKAVRRLGYTDIETIGMLGHDRAALRDMMQGAGIVSRSQHICPPPFFATMAAWSQRRIPMAAVFQQTDETFGLDRLPALVDQAIADAVVLNQDSIVWTSLLARDLASPRSIRKIADAFEAAGRACRSAGLSFAFHNGSKGFVPVEGRLPYDLLLDWTDPTLVRMELDVFWARKVGIDPIAYLRRHGARYRLLHLKDVGADGEIRGIGDGVLDFAAILGAARDAGIARCYVEYDQAPDPLRAAGEALRRLRLITPS